MKVNVESMQQRKEDGTVTEFMFQGQHDDEILIVFGRLCFGTNVKFFLLGGEGVL